MLRTAAAVVVGKTISLLTRVLKKGGGTAAPGLYALKIAPYLTEHFSKQFTRGTIVITGTNGKTTTSRLISHYFSQHLIPYIHNRAGSNLERGIVSACLQKATLTGQLKKTEYALWELDEAAFAKIIDKLNPTIVVLLNLFRDQLDRYGEVDTTKNKWLSALEKISSPLILIYNTDDPVISDLVNKLVVQNKWIEAKGISVKYVETNTNQMRNTLSPLNMIICPSCKHRLKLLNETVVGQGEYTCDNCKLKNPKPEYITTLDTISEKGLSGTFENNQSFSTNLTGVFNAYNITAAEAVIDTAQHRIQDFFEDIQNFSTAFGRMETIKLGKATLILCLIKNPTGFTEALKVIFHNDLHEHVVFALNDNYADGTDVSWIWDANIEGYLPSTIKHIHTTGTRAYDISVRLKYSGKSPDITTEKNITTVLEHLKDCEQSVPIFATYTALLEIQKYLEKTGVKTHYWKE